MQAIEAFPLLERFFILLKHKINIEEQFMQRAAIVKWMLNTYLYEQMPLIDQ